MTQDGPATRGEALEVFQKAQDQVGRGRRVLQPAENVTSVSVTEDGYVHLMRGESKVESLRLFTAVEDPESGEALLKAVGAPAEITMPTRGGVAYRASVDLLLACGKAAARMQQRIAVSHFIYLGMLAVLFLIGVVGFAAALWRGWQSDPQAIGTSAVFGGLSAVSFIAFFLSKPVEAMSVTGPQNAWLLAIINTYWMKLAYLENTQTAIEDLDDAQDKLDRALIAYLRETSLHRSSARHPNGKAKPGEARGAGNGSRAAAGSTTVPKDAGTEAKP